VPGLAGVEILDEQVEVGLLRVGRVWPAGLVVVAGLLEYQVPAS
jgi:hypothetical protein